MRIFTNDQIRQIDRYTIEHEGVTALELIERLAEGAAAEITSRWRPSKPVVVFAGPGNNGADALAIARLLSEQGFRIRVFLFNMQGKSASAECVACRDMLANCSNVLLTEVIQGLDLPIIQSNYLVIDGLFGTGFRAPLNSSFAVLIDHINTSGATVVSIDIPSGLSGDWNPQLVSRNVLHASLTLAVQYPRLSFFMPENEELIGEWKILDIGLNDKAMTSSAVKYYLIEENDIYDILRPRPLFTSKADYGSAIIYAGSYGMIGAAALAARGALRSGVGKLTVEAPKCGYTIMQTSVPEALFKHNAGEFHLERIVPQHRYNAIAIGPGIGTDEKTIRALEEFLAAAKMPVVLDADALNCMALKPTMLNLLPTLSVLTPHAGEFDRLFGQHNSWEARLRTATEVARRHNIFIVLKGHYTAIARPDGKIYFNSSGTPAMATPGAGDVLTGAITAFLAQGYKPMMAIMAAVFVHGVAGEFAADRNGDYGVTAGDIADNLGRAIKSIMEPTQQR